MADQAKPRKILGTPDAPYFDSLKELISSQSRETLLKWVIPFVETEILPIFEARASHDTRARTAIEAAHRASVYNDISARFIKPIVMNCHAAARDMRADPAAQAAARTCAMASSCTYEIGHTLGIAYFGAAASAYNQVGVDADAETYEKLAAEFVGRYQAALEAIAVADEPEPLLLEWHL